jgi:hypothetical protein
LAEIEFHKIDPWRKITRRGLPLKVHKIPVPLRFSQVSQMMFLSGNQSKMKVGAVEGRRFWVNTLFKGHLGQAVSVNCGVRVCYKGSV